MSDLPWKIISCVPAAALVATSIGLFLSWRALRANLRSLEEGHEWNRRKAAADVNASFLSSEIQEHWRQIYEPVLMEKKKFDDLDESTRESVLVILRFFEHVGVLIENHV